MAVAGAEVTGPLETVTAALDVIANADFDAVTLDIKLRGERSYSVADALAARNSPFVFLNGYGLPMFPPSPCESGPPRKTGNTGGRSADARNASRRTLSCVLRCSAPDNSQLMVRALVWLTPRLTLRQSVRPFFRGEADKIDWRVRRFDSCRPRCTMTSTAISRSSTDPDGLPSAATTLGRNAALVECSCNAGQRVTPAAFSSR
jgi:hypothetical protein